MNKYETEIQMVLDRFSSHREEALLYVAAPGLSTKERAERWLELWKTIFSFAATNCKVTSISVASYIAWHGMQRLRLTWKQIFKVIGTPQPEWYVKELNRGLFAKTQKMRFRSLKRVLFVHDSDPDEVPRALPLKSWLEPEPFIAVTASML